MKTGEELRHPRGKCVVPGLVVVKIIYTPEEAERRRAEDKEVTETFEKARKQVRTPGSTETVRTAMPYFAPFNISSTSIHVVTNSKHSTLDPKELDRPFDKFYD